ncbi:MAG: hypothetical protein LBD53_05085, partial [Tannerella sp.]|nr:hypothetical protein [Tannerella sp.]
MFFVIWLIVRELRVDECPVPQTLAVVFKPCKWFSATTLAVVLNHCKGSWYRHYLSFGATIPARNDEATVFVSKISG